MRRDLMVVQHRGTNWTPEEDRRLLDLIEANKSWVFISANLKRPVKTIRDRVSQMQRFGLKAKGEMTGLRPASRPWTLTDDDMLRKLLASGMKQRLIAQKMKRSIGAIQSRIFLLKKPRKRLTVRPPPTSDN